MLRKTTLTVALLLIAALTITACGGGDTGSNSSTSTGDELFQEATIGSLAGCKTCHSLEPEVVIIGPSLAGIGTLAESRVTGVLAEDYLRQSILDPNAHLVEGFPANVMPNTYQKQLTEEQIEALVNYMLTLK
jgi:mono/diheme cytochrome c family protein